MGVPKAAFTTLGCKVNQYETQRIIESFAGAGFEIVPFDAVADVYVINSCSVTSVAEGKSRYTIRRAARTNPLAKVVVTGCAAQMALNKNEAIEGAHVVVPNPEKLDALKYLFEFAPDLERAARESGSAITPSATLGRTRATVKLQDGCNVHCAYCSIPFTRPGMVSREASQVLAEVRRLAELGYREVVLTGVLIGAYGPESGSGGPGFEDIVGSIAQVEGVERVRISSIEMHQVSDRLIDLMRAGKVVPHLHIPLQSGDDEVLADMNRRYRKSDYLALCDRLYREVADISLTTDIMVGFPTETPEAFASTAEVCERAAYLKAHVFRFSPRYGTPADQWGDPIDPAEKQDRSKVLMGIAARTSEAHKRRFLGRTMRVLIEGRSAGSGLLSGLTDNYLEVKLSGPKEWVGRCVDVRLDELSNGALLGERVTASRTSELLLSAAR
ncbi:MAG: tRNA (N(6)-L-threonylcarbamoyladenosine(37)-C(2))-methylthiotransferase MtaB [Chthonomonadaceae bacterium]